MVYLKGRALMIMTTAACGMGFLLFGYDQGVMGGVIGSTSFKARFKNPNATQQGLIVGLYDLGCLVGSLGTSLFPNARRRTCIYFGAITVIVGTILQVTSYTVGQLIAGRVVTGIGIGTNTAIIPAWQAEISPTHSRGALITIGAALIIVGLSISNWLCFGASYAKSSLQWQFPISFQVVFALYLLITVPFLVESPRWVANNVSMDQARHVISRLRGRPEDDPVVVEVANEIQRALEEESRTEEKFGILRHGGQQNLRRMLLGVGGLLMQQMSGINAVAYYMPVILQQYVGLAPTLSLILSSAAAVQFFIVSLLPVWCIEKLGRRTWLIWGAALQALVMILVIVGFNVGGRGGGILVTTMFFLFYDVFAVSYLNVPWMYAPEINNLKMRAQGAALASASNWLFNGIVVTVTPMGLSNIGWKYWIIWVVMNVCFVPLVYFCYPETRGLSLEKIDSIFEGNQGRGIDALTQGVRYSVKLSKGEILLDAPLADGDNSQKGERDGKTAHMEVEV